MCCLFGLSASPRRVHASFWLLEAPDSLAQVVGQSYNFLRLGFEGYRRVQAYAREVATDLSARIAELGPFQLLTKGDELPVFAFTLEDGIDNFTVFDVSNALRERGWLRQLPRLQKQSAPVHERGTATSFHH